MLHCGLGIRNTNTFYTFRCRQSDSPTNALFLWKFWTYSSKEKEFENLIHFETFSFNVEFVLNAELKLWGQHYHNLFCLKLHSSVNKCSHTWSRKRSRWSWLMCKHSHHSFSCKYYIFVFKSHASLSVNVHITSLIILRITEGWTSLEEEEEIF